MNPPWYLTEPLQAGAKFASLTVLAELPRKSMNRSYAVQCDCGEESVAWHSGLVQGRTKSCPACTIRRLREAQNPAERLAWKPIHVMRAIGMSDATATRWAAKDDGFANLFIVSGHPHRPTRVTVSRVLYEWALTTPLLSRRQRKLLIRAIGPIQTEETL